VAHYREADALLRHHGDRGRHGIARTRHWTSRSASAPAPLKAEILQLAQRARLDLELTPPHQPEPAAGFEITAREAEVFALLATGRTNREIGRALFISERPPACTSATCSASST
jgi:DNA-binding NarL/FixJ family response regulator